MRNTQNPFLLSSLRKIESRPRYREINDGPVKSYLETVTSIKVNLLL